MSDRIHHVLDGEASPEDLSPEERARLAAMRPALERAAASVRAARAPDLVGRVMTALPRAAPAPVPAWRRAAGWLWKPRPVRIALRPAYGLAVAAVAALLLVPPRGGVPGAADGGLATAPVVVRSPAPAETPVVYVQFRLETADASRVALAGDFTGWKPRYTLRETAPGVWTALVPVPPGVHDYAFVVDGDRWIADPSAPQVEDDFGGTNSRISLPAPGAAT